MLHKKFMSVILAVVAALTMSIVAMAQDDEDSGVLELTLLADGDVIEGELSEDAPTLLFVFNANEGDEVTITMEEADDSGLDPFLALLGPAGEVLASNDDVDFDGGDYNSALEEIELPETGTYFIIASSYAYRFTNEFEGDALAFELSIEGITEVEGMEEGFQFFAAELADGEAVAAETSEDQAAWYFIFEGEEGDEISITTNSDDFDTSLFVFGPEGVRVAAADDLALSDDETDLNAAVEGVELPADGVYLVMVMSPYMFYLGPDAASDEYFGEFEIELTVD